MADMDRGYRRGPAGLDFGAKAFAENKIASQIQSHGFPAKPSVSIAGFPFLTQAATRDIHQITISSSNIKAGPVTVTSLTVVADSVKVSSSFNGGTTGPVHGTILISLGALGERAIGGGPADRLPGRWRAEGRLGRQ